MSALESFAEPKQENEGLTIKMIYHMAHFCTPMFTDVAPMHNAGCCPCCIVDVVDRRSSAGGVPESVFAIDEPGCGNENDCSCTG